jgi:hypothetical protein
MAYAKRYLSLFSALLLGLIPALKVKAQLPDTPVIFRVIAIGASIGPLLYEQAPGQIMAVSAGHNELSSSYVCPPDGELSFFSEIPATKPNEHPRRVPIAKVQLSKKGGPFLVVLSPPSGPYDLLKTEVQVIDDSWDAHPLQTARVLNYSKRRAAVQVASTTAEVASAGTHVFPYPSGKGYVILKIALM